MPRLIGIAVSAGILLLIYWQVDFGAVATALRRCDPGWLTVSLGLVIPLTLLTGWRFALVVPKAGVLPVGEALRLTLIASTLNMILPSKMGDLAKAFFVSDRCRVTQAFSLALVVFEKGWDLLALLAWGLLAVAIYPDAQAWTWGGATLIAALLLPLLALLISTKLASVILGGAARLLPGKAAAKTASLQQAWTGLLGDFYAQPRRAASVVALSLFIWFVHLLQIWLFTRAIGAEVPFVASLALAPLAILAGLLPFTFAGVGTRDAALILLYSPYMTAAEGAALGVLCTLRYLLPALAGLPLAGAVVSTMRRLRTQAP